MASNNSVSSSGNKTEQKTWADMARPTSVAVITAAGKGMGEAIAREFASRGYKVVLLSPSDNCVKLAAELGGVAHKGSVTNKDDLDALVKLALDTYGRIDVLVNNTGHPPKGDLLSLTDEQWQQGTDLCLMNVIRLTRLVTPVFLKQGGGAIVNMSSVAALEPNAAFPISSVVRAGLSNFTKLYANQYAKDNIRMNTVLPGFIDSYDAKNFLSQIPAGRAGTVAEMAKTVAFLASSDAGYITGQSIKLDGGMSKSF